MWLWKASLSDSWLNLVAAQGELCQGSELSKLGRNTTREPIAIERNPVCLLEHEITPGVVLFHVALE